MDLPGSPLRNTVLAKQPEMTSVIFLFALGQHLLSQGSLCFVSRFTSMIRNVFIRLCFMCDFCFFLTKLNMCQAAEWCCANICNQLKNQLPVEKLFSETFFPYPNLSEGQPPIPPAKTKKNIPVRGADHPPCGKRLSTYCAVALPQGKPERFELRRVKQTQWRGEQPGRHPLPPRLPLPTPTLINTCVWQGLIPISTNAIKRSQTHTHTHRQIDGHMHVLTDW